MEKTTKLHLGCGERYFEGYINIDYPPSKQTIIKAKVDKYADILKLSYKPNSVDEIRLHHVFEHFDRPTALALLCKWRTWLKPRGLLRIETPDAMACYKLMVSPWISFNKKQQVNRHLFGSHEAEWAVHWDGWYKERYLYILNQLGFEKITFKYNKWGLLRNIEVFAIKSRKSFSVKKYQQISGSILKTSTVRVGTKDPNEPEGTERKLLNYWIQIWTKIFNYAGKYVTN